MKNKFNFLALLGISTLLVFSACNKKKEKEEAEKLAKEEQTLEADNSQQSKDQSQVKGETDGAFDDANVAFSGTSAGKSVNALSVCGATVDTTNIASKLVLINYDGSTVCNGRKRAGQIKVQLVSGTSWRNAGAVMQLTYIDFKVTRVSDSKSITINGTQSVTKLTTFDWMAVYLTGSGSASYKTRSNNMSITFDDGTVRTWSAAHKSTYAIAASVVTATHEGDTTISGTSAVSHWGTTRNNYTFTTAISTPIVSNNTCGFWKPISGVVTHKVNTKNFTVTFGVDASGALVTSGCAYGYKINWLSIAGESKQAIIAY